MLAMFTDLIGHSTSIYVHWKVTSSRMRAFVHPPTTTLTSVIKKGNEPLLRAMANQAETVKESEDNDSHHHHLIEHRMLL